MTPSLTVDPSTGLSGGNVVHVAASGLPAGADVRIIQCDQFNDDFEMDCWPTSVIAAADDGSLTADVTLADPVPRNTFSGDPDWVYCRADICRLFLVWSDSDGVTQVLSSPPLGFTGSPATIAVSPSSDLQDVQDVTAQGTAFGAEGRSFRLVEEACFRIIQARECHGDSVIGSGVVHSDSTWSTRVRVSRWLADGSDCTYLTIPFPSAAAPCQVTIVILDGNGDPDNSFGVSSVGEQHTFLSFRGTSPIQEVTDEGIAPPAPWAFLSPPKRFDVAWGFPQTNTTWHQVMDASGLGLFDSGAVDAGGSYTARLFAAATYRVLDPTTGARASVPVPVRLVPAEGLRSASFAIVWASETAPAGLVYDVRILRPGSTRFVSWRTGTSVPRAFFIPDRGPGAYVFEARLRSISSGDVTSWSPYRALHVT